MLTLEPYINYEFIPYNVEKFSTRYIFKIQLVHPLVELID